MSRAIWPAVNAGLNATTALLLVAGWLQIRAKRVAIHRACMLGAAGTSALFFGSYLTYHARVGSVRFTGAGWGRSAYVVVLSSHTVLAAVIVPLVLRTLWLAAHERFESHRAIARWTLPIWLYVSVTGVLVYWMLYQWKM